MSFMIEPRYKWFAFRRDGDLLFFHIGNVGYPDRPYSVSRFTAWITWSEPGYRWYWTGVDHYDGRPLLAFGCGLFRIGFFW